VLAFDRHNRSLLDSDVRVIAGPFESTIGRMLHFGWNFDVSVDQISFGDMLLCGRNYKSNTVFQCLINNYRYAHIRDFRVMYVPADTVLSVEISRSTYIPPIALHSAHVGKLVMGPAGREDMIIYEAGVKNEEPSEIIVMPEDIPGLLDKILKAQEPKAKEILKNERRRSEMSELKLKAKILTFDKTG